MRKRNIAYFFDTLMWYLLYLLPLIAFIISFCLGQNLTFSSLFFGIGLDIVSDNIVLITLVSIFGSTGVFPVFSSNDLLIYLTYFICVFVIHILVDFLLFIPRFCHKLLDKGEKNA